MGAAEGIHDILEARLGNHGSRNKDTSDYGIIFCDFGKVSELHILVFSADASLIGLCGHLGRQRSGKLQTL